MTKPPIRWLTKQGRNGLKVLLLCSSLILQTSSGFHVASTISMRDTSRKEMIVISSSSSGSNERVKKLLQIKKLKEEGGDYESLLSPTPGAKPKTNKEIDYMDLLNENENDGTDDYDEEDRAMYEELKRQEKQALVDKILKAKQQAQQQKAALLASKSQGGGGGAGAFADEDEGVVNKGQPSPYLASAVAAAGQRSSDPEERFKDVETYMPQSAGWGKWARPKNIPEAFGGGKPIPEGGIKFDDDDQEWKAKYDNWMAQVKEYKKEVSGTELTPAEKMDEEKIKVAREQARRYMLRGEYQDAVNVLQPFRKICSVRSKLGAQTLMDLAVAYEAIYDFENAQAIYKQVRSSPVKDMRSKAKALNYGAEAMKRLGLGSKSQVNPKYLVNFAYIPSQLEGSYGLYMKSKGGLDLDDVERPVIDSVRDALEVLEDACIAQGVGIRMDMVTAALRAIHIDTLSADEAVAGRFDQPLPAKELDGRWRLRITSYQEAVEFMTKTEIWQRLDSSSNTIQGKLPLSPFESIRDYKSEYTWESKKRVLNYGSTSNTFSLPSGKPHTLRVLVIKDTIMITSRSDSKGSTPRESYENRFAVWTRAA